MKKFLLLFLMISLLLSACNSNSIDNESDTQANNEISEESSSSKRPDRKMRIYVFGDYEYAPKSPPRLIKMVTVAGCMDISDDHYYYTRLLDQFMEEEGIEIEVAFGYGGLLQLRDNNSYYDLIIDSTARTNWPGTGQRNDIVSMSELLNEDYCYNMASFFKEENLYGEDYVKPIMKAGLVDEKQYYFPLSFNLPMLFTSEESLERHKLNIGADSTYDELMSALLDSYHDQIDDIPLYQPHYHYRYPYYPYRLFLEGAGRNLSDNNLGFYKKLITFTEGYMSTVETIGDIDGMMWGGANEAFDLIKEKVACFSSFNAAGQIMPFALQAAYYESKYTELGERFTAIAIPEEDKVEQYAAKITTYGVIPKNSLYPETACKLLKYLADADFGYLYDMSVNRNRINDTLKELSDPGKEFELVQRRIFEEYTMEPMSEDTAVYLQEVIDKIDFAMMMDDEEMYARIQRPMNDYLEGTIDSDTAVKKMAGIEEEEESIKTP